MSVLHKCQLVLQPDPAVNLAVEHPRRVVNIASKPILIKTVINCYVFITDNIFPMAIIFGSYSKVGRIHSPLDHMTKS
jgi:hypothetical protein